MPIARVAISGFVVWAVGRRSCFFRVARAIATFTVSTSARWQEALTSDCRSHPLFKRASNQVHSPSPSGSPRRLFKRAISLSRPK